MCFCRKRQKFSEHSVFDMYVNLKFYQKTELTFISLIEFKGGLFVNGRGHQGQRTASGDDQRMFTVGAKLFTGVVRVGGRGRTLYGWNKL